jgi:ribose/xylose/arabinose/galactoside ABC-type transport system permease subunit
MPERVAILAVALLGLVCLLATGGMVGLAVSGLEVPPAIASLAGASLGALMGIVGRSTPQDIPGPTANRVGPGPAGSSPTGPPLH